MKENDTRKSQPISRTQSSENFNFEKSLSDGKMVTAKYQIVTKNSIAKIWGVPKNPPSSDSKGGVIKMSILAPTAPKRDPSKEIFDTSYPSGSTSSRSSNTVFDQNKKKFENLLSFFSFTVKYNILIIANFKLI